MGGEPDVHLRIEQRVRGSKLSALSEGSGIVMREHIYSPSSFAEELQP